MKSVCFGILKLLLREVAPMSAVLPTKAGMRARLLTFLAFVLVSPAMAETTNGIVYKVRLANGTSQSYPLVVSPNVPTAKAVKWATPSAANNKLSLHRAQALWLRIPRDLSLRYFFRLFQRMGVAVSFDLRRWMNHT